MKKKRMKGLPKRIAAFVMAVLMFCSLMPIDPSVFFAEESYTYTFMVTNNETDNLVALENATITLYETEGSTEAVSADSYTWNVVKEGEGEEATVVAGKYVLSSTIDLTGYYYVISADGYQSSAKTMLSTLDEGVDEYEVKLSEKEEITLSFDNVISVEEAVQLVVGNVFTPQIVVLGAGENELSEEDKTAITSAITYSSDLGEGSTVLTLNEFGVVTAGNTASEDVITITASFLGNDKYKPATATFKIKVVDKLPQNININYEGLKIDGTLPEGIQVDEENNKITYTTDYLNQEVHVGVSIYRDDEVAENVELTYTITDDDGEDTYCAVVRDEETGKLIIKGAGTAVITISAAGDATYADSEVKKLTIVVEKQNPEFSFGEITNFDLICGEYKVGENVFIAPTLQMPDDLENNVNYSITDENGVINTQEFNEDGTIEFTGKVGTVTITASYAGDGKYTEAEKSYTINVAYASLEDVEIKVNETVPVANAWHNAAVSVTMPEGYQYCETTEDATWSEAGAIYLHTLSSTDEIVNEVQRVELFVKNVETGAIGLFTYEYKYDNQAASVSALMSDTKNLKDTIMDFFKFIFGDDVKDEEKKVTIDISVSADGAPVNAVYYYVDNTNAFADIDVNVILANDNITWTQMHDISDTDNTDADIDLKLDITKKGTKVIYVKVVDEAGNVSCASTDGLVFDATAPEVNVEIQTDAVNDYYLEDVVIKVSAKETDAISGIKSIKYVIYKDGVAGNEVELFSSEVVDETTRYENLVADTGMLAIPLENIIVDSVENDSQNVTVVITVEDNAGNVTTVEQPLKISATVPTITPDTFDNTESSVDLNIVSRADVFNENGLVISGKVTVKGVETDIVKDTHYTVEWKDGDNDSEKIAIIKFIADGVYSEIKASYTDIVNRNVETTLTNGFVIDNKAPTATITIGQSKWESFIETITFGLWSSDKVELTIEATDNVDARPVIEYVKVNASSKIWTKDSLKEDATLVWTTYENHPVAIPENEGNEIFVIYVRVTDANGKVDYFSSNGYIVDMQTDGDDSIAITAPTEGKGSYTIGESRYECYRNDVILKITAIDDAAGIQKIVYKIGEADKLGEQNPIVLYSYIYDAENTKEPVRGNNALVEYDSYTYHPMKVQDEIIVSADEYNYDDVTVWVELTDNAGNVTKEEITLNILKDTSNIKLTNTPIPPNATVNNVDYYKSIYTTEFTIHSRESIFNKDGVVIKVLDDNHNPVDASLYSIIYDEKYEVGDEHKFTIVFNGSTKYNLSIDYTDAIGESAESYTDVFVVDRENPTATVKVNTSVWNKFLEKITFGWWSSEAVTVKATAHDALSDVTVEYILLENVSSISKEELSKRNDWQAMPENGVFVSESNAYIVAVKVTDTATNEDYFSSNGFIVDKEEEKDLISVETSAIKTSGYYTDNVLPITIKVAESGAGIQKITYMIVKNNDVANATVGTLYELIYDTNTQKIINETNLENVVAKKDGVTGFVEEFSDTIDIISKDYNFEDVYVMVTVTDNAGNMTTSDRVDIPIAVETPEMVITYEEDTEVTGTDKNQIKHYTSGRKAKIVITSRDDLFNKDNVSIVVNETRKENTNSTYSIIWDDNAESGTHIAYVTFPENARYDFTVNYHNVVGVAVETYKETFVIDNKKPDDVSIKIGETSWFDEWMEDITFGFWNAEIEVSAIYSDVTSDIQSVEYIKISDVKQLDKTLSETELNKIGWKEYTKSISVKTDETFVVYVKVTDYAGNYKIVSSKGVIVDTTKELDISLNPTTKPTNNYYRDDIVVDVVVKDLWENMTSYSGINKVVYWVEADGVITQKEEILYQFSETEPTYDKLVPELIFDNKEVCIDASKNNSDNVVLHVKATDNAGNSEEKTLLFRIDSIQPEIYLDYDADVAKAIINGYGLYDEVRSATVVIIERTSTFSDSKATQGIEIVVRDAKGNKISNADYDISDWKHTGSGDDASHTATITFNGDGYYTVAVSYEDIAGNTNKEVVTTASENPYHFVVDKEAADVYLIADAPSITVENSNHTHAIYTNDFNVSLSVDDGAMTSGLQKVEYYIKNGQNKTLEKTLYEFDGNSAVIKLEQLLSESLFVDSEKNNSCHVVLHVTVTDNVGHKVEKELIFDIDVDKPIVNVSFDNNIPQATVDDRGYYTDDRTATIVVEKRAEHFDTEIFKKGIIITAVDSKNNVVEEAYKLVSETHDGNIHTYVIAFSKDANYEFNLEKYKDLAELENESDIFVKNQSVTPNKFTIDRVLPDATITADGLKSWVNEVVSKITFGLWTPFNLDIVITAEDVTSSVKSVEYYKTSTFTGLTLEELEAEAKWVVGDSFTVSKDDIFVVYAKITDQTGNVRYISTNGIIVDDTKPVFETLSPEITITPEYPLNGIYDGNVLVDVSVVDPKVGENSAYSGIRTIRYEVYSMGVKTQEGTLYNFTESNPTHNKLLQKWNEQDIIIDASRNNSNDVVVRVMANDNVGNYTEEEISLMIDTTKPVVEISYDNNNGDTTFADAVYYNANRIATIKVTERNFDAKYVDVVITNTDGVIPSLSGWTKQEGTGNGDDTVYTATIAYSVDGDYTFAVALKDKAGNANNGINYGESQAPTAFTIDKTTPIISIAYDNNAFVNENYYKADRIATITINEHNFDASRVVATITATDNGQPVVAPVITNWNKSGDTYTATVSYTADALYTFDISYSDKAGNEASDFEEQSFYVDKTMPQMSITEIVDQSANNKDKIGFVITATDTNFDVFTPVLTAVTKTENGFATQEVNIASVSDIVNGRVYTINNIDTDGIYRITCTLVDKAGNAYTEVTLHHEDGTAYIEERTAEDVLLSFSVNRDGSTFEVDEATKEILDDYYVYDAKDDIVIIEVNANILTSKDVTLNGKVLVEGSEYTVTTEGGNGAWMKYIYTLNKALFSEEGEYTLVVSSVDEAENNAFSDVKDTKIAFVVDRTAPVVTISGLETDGRYQTEAQTVTLIPTDDGGAVNSIVVNQVNEEGSVVKVLQEELSGEALEEALNTNNGQITFDIPSGQYDYIEIVCSDCSVNSDGKANVSEILIENVLITENPVEIFWATYQYAIIGGGAATVAVPTGVVLFRKRLKLKVK